MKSYNQLISNITWTYYTVPLLGKILGINLYSTLIICQMVCWTITSLSCLLLFFNFHASCCFQTLYYRLSEINLSCLQGLFTKGFLCFFYIIWFMWPSMISISCLKKFSLIESDQVTNIVSVGQARGSSNTVAQTLSLTPRRRGQQCQTLKSLLQTYHGKGNNFSFNWNKVLNIWTISIYGGYRQQQHGQCDPLMKEQELWPLSSNPILWDSNHLEGA